MSEDRIAESIAELLKWAAIAGEVYGALRDQKLPEQLSADLTFAWLTDPVPDE